MNGPKTGVVGEPEALFRGPNRDWDSTYLC
jgi:hypothetical protein